MSEIIKDKEYYVHRVVDIMVPSVLALIFLYACATAPHAKKVARKHGKEGFSRPEMIVNTPIPQANPEMNATEFQNFTVAVQGLLSDNWPVQSVSMDGIVTIKPKDGVELHCATLDPTPNDSNNPFKQYGDVQDIAKALRVDLPDQTLLIWGNNIGILPGSKGGAGRVKTDELVWACPEVVLH